MSSEKAQDDVLEISVGGKVFSCRRSTLRLEKESLLAKMFDPDSPFGGDVLRDPAGRPFIDRDGDIFATILKYLRNGGSLPLHNMSISDLNELQYEAEYFTLQQLVDFTKNELKEREEATERKRKERKAEEYEKEKKRVCKKWGFDTEQHPPQPQECISFTCDVAAVGDKINEVTCAPNEYSGYKVHSIVPILENGTTVKMAVVMVGWALVQVAGPTEEEQQYLPL